MASGFIAPDGRDFDSIFTRANGGGGIDTGYQTADGVDLRSRYIAGNSGIVTGFIDPAGVDLGARFGSLVNAHFATFGADLDNAAFWVFYFNNPEASGIYDNWGYVGGTEKWVNRDLMLSVAPYLSTYAELSFSWGPAPNDPGRGTMQIIQVPNPANWNEVRVQQTDPPNGAGWGRFHLYMTARG